MSAVQGYKCGALILQSSANLIQNVVRAAEHILETLYLPLPLLPPTATVEVHDFSSSQNKYVGLLGRLYQDLKEQVPKLDIRVILPSLPDSPPTPLSHNLDIIVSAYADLSQTQCSPAYRLIAGRIPPSLAQYSFLSVQGHHSLFQASGACHAGSHEHVAVGGTFDHMHQGHHLLLAATALSSSNSCFVGVASGPLLADKVLSELIQSLEKRSQLVREILSDMRPGLKLDVMPITDPYGPTITDTKFQCLIVSEETSKGGASVNRKRNELGMPSMDILQVPLIAGSADKLSSSQQRKDLLGVYRHLPDPQTSPLSSAVYVVGLTGGTCSGKTTIANHLSSLSACIVDCDKLGHVAYEPSTATFSRVVGEFGSGVLAHDGTIDRKALGAIVFSDPNKLHLLNQIVWPAIADLAKAQIAAASERGAEVCVLDAAVLLEAGWQKFVDEVWVVFVSEEEASKRLIARNGISAEFAHKRIAAQMSNRERIDRGNVLLCSLWEHEVTCAQVDKAWTSLKERYTAKCKYQSV